MHCDFCVISMCQSVRYKQFVTVVVYFYLLPCKPSCLRQLFCRISDDFYCVFLSGAVYAVVDYLAHNECGLIAMQLSICM